MTDAEPRANVLLVDDLPANLIALEVVLEDLGHDLVRATGGEQALQLLAQQDFAVILLDQRMPGLDGFQTAERIRRGERSRHTPIIFITADDDELSAERAYALGAVDHLVKPIVPVILRAKVAGFVDLYRAKERARRQAEQFRLLIQDTADYAIFMLDPQGRILTWNAGAQRAKGYRAEDIIGQHFSRFYTQPDLDRDWPAQELKRAVAEGRYAEEGWRVRKDGSTFWANVVITALKDAAGNLLGFSKVTRDLTERKQAEDALVGLNQALERRVEERTAELAASNAKLREADRRKDDFLAMLAHELRNPLAPVLTSLHVLRLGPDRQTQEQALAMMDRQARHMARLVDELLDVSRLTHGKIQLRRERLDLGRLVRTVVGDHRKACDDSGVAIAVEVPETPVWVSGDATRLSQVLMNLLTNACKFTDRGGRVEIRLEPEQEGHQAVVRVRDTGVGIAADVLSRLFEPFSQADRSLDRTRGGLGLGLALVKGLMELHGGSVTARSDGPGKGSEFTLRLPFEELPALAAVDAPARVAVESMRVLVVEDNKDAAESLKLFLELLGHEVRVAHTGPEGVRVADAWRPDAVLCDIGLPGLDGYGVADELRKRSVTPKARLIAITGYGSYEDRERAKQAGFQAHVTKPADPNVLLSLLTRPLK